MSDSNKPGFGSAQVMPVTGSGCGIRPSEAAMGIEFGIDFSAAKQLLQQHTSKQALQAIKNANIQQQVTDNKK